VAAGPQARHLRGDGDGPGQRRIRRRADGRRLALKRGPFDVDVGDDTVQ